MTKSKTTKTKLTAALRIPRNYHSTFIPRGVYGSFAKIQEEFLEMEDANKQDNILMVLLEMSDLIGAIDGFLRKNVPGVTLADILRMAEATRRACDNGDRGDDA